MNSLKDMNILFLEDNEGFAKNTIEFLLLYFKNVFKHKINEIVNQPSDSTTENRTQALHEAAIPPLFSRNVTWRSLNDSDKIMLSELTTGMPKNNN